MRKKYFRALLLGLGFDCRDGHLRISRGDNFHLYGGSENTHNFMLEKAIKFNEQLDKKGKNLNEISSQEFSDIAQKVGLKLYNTDNN